MLKSKIAKEKIVVVLIFLILAIFLSLLFSSFVKSDSPTVSVTSDKNIYRCFGGNCPIIVTFTNELGVVLENENVSVILTSGIKSLSYSDNLGTKLNLTNGSSTSFTINLNITSLSEDYKFNITLNVSGNLYILDPYILGCSENTTHITCEDGSFTGSYIDTTKNITISNATITSNSSGTRTLRFNSTGGDLIIMNSLLDSHLDGGWYDSSEKDNLFWINASTTEIYNTSILNYGGDGLIANSPNGAGAGGNPTMRIYTQKLITKSVNITSYGGAGGDGRLSGGSYWSGGDGGNSYTYLYILNYWNSTNTTFKNNAGYGGGGTNNGYGGTGGTSTFQIHKLNNLNLNDDIFYIYAYGGWGGNSGEAPAVYNGKPGGNGEIILNIHSSSLEKIIKLYAYGGKGGDGRVNTPGEFVIGGTGGNGKITFNGSNINISISSVLDCYGGNAGSWGSGSASSYGNGGDGHFDIDMTNKYLINNQTVINSDRGLGRYGVSAQLNSTYNGDTTNNYYITNELTFFDSVTLQADGKTQNNEINITHSTDNRLGFFNTNINQADHFDVYCLDGLIFGSSGTIPNITFHCSYTNTTLSNYYTNVIINYSSQIPTSPVFNNPVYIQVNASSNKNLTDIINVTYYVADPNGNIIIDNHNGTWEGGNSSLGEQEEWHSENCTANVVGLWDWNSTATDNTSKTRFTNGSFTIADITPIYSANVSSSGIHGTNHTFNITWTDESSVWYMFNSTNYTDCYELPDGVWQFNKSSSLEIGFHTYEWYANSSTGTENKTGIINFEVYDGTKPHIVINTPSGTSSSLTVSFNFDITDDVNVSVCWYNVTRGASLEVDTVWSNQSIVTGATTNWNDTFTVASGAPTTYKFYSGCNDSVDNWDIENSTFIVDTTGNGNGNGGGGGGIPPTVEEREPYECNLPLEKYGWRAQSDTQGHGYNLITPERLDRIKRIYVQNTQTKEVKLTFTCFSNTSLICDYVTFSTDELILPVTGEELYIEVSIDLTNSNYTYGENHLFFVIIKDKKTCQDDFPFLIKIRKWGYFFRMDAFVNRIFTGKTIILPLEEWADKTDFKLPTWLITIITFLGLIALIWFVMNKLIFKSQDITTSIANLIASIFISATITIILTMFIYVS